MNAYHPGIQSEINGVSKLLDLVTMFAASYQNHGDNMEVPDVDGGIIQLLHVLVGKWWISPGTTGLMSSLIPITLELAHYPHDGLYYV